MVLSVTMVTFRVTTLMNKFTINIKNDDTLSTTCDEMLSWMIVIRMEITW